MSAAGEKRTQGARRDAVTISDQVMSIFEWVVVGQEGSRSSLKLSSLPDESRGVPLMRLSMREGAAKTSVFLVLEKESHYPATEGALERIEWSVSARCTEQSGDPVTVALVLEQGESVYAGPPITVRGKEWERVAQQDLSARAFGRVAGSGPAHPVLDKRGQPIRFGFGAFWGRRRRPIDLEMADWGVRFETMCLFESGKAACCGEEAIPLDEHGNVVVPSGTVANSIGVEYVDYEVGEVDKLYPDSDTSTAHWYGRFPCETAVGDTLPPGVVLPEPGDFLKDLETQVGLALEDVTQTLEGWGEMIAQKESQKTSHWPDYPIAAPFAPKTREVNANTALGGRDIVFVHGLKLEHLGEKLLNPNLPSWKDPSSFPASGDNPEFYSGYFKNLANKTWLGDAYASTGVIEGHVKKFLLDRGYKNRFLVVAYNNADRAEDSARAILTQIGDAMAFGTGVVDPTGKPVTDFGMPNFVIVSHSAGALVTDIAMWAAANFPQMGAQHIAQYAKAHISSHGAFLGSHYATAFLGLYAGFTDSFLTGLGWPSVLAGIIASELDFQFSGNILQLMTAAGGSILVDLVPRVAQEKWRGAVQNTPVRTVMIAGGHPTDFSPLSQALLPGISDGVLSVASQVASPNHTEAWPTSFYTNGIGLAKNFDLGVFGPPIHVNVSLGGSVFGVNVQLTSTGLNNPRRALHWYAHQKFSVKGILNLACAPDQPPPHGPCQFSSAVVPYLSPSGMVLSNVNFYPLGTGPVPITPDPWKRASNHFSFIQSASDHFLGTHDAFANRNFIGHDYLPTDSLNGIERNLEETLAITDSGIYQGYGPDNVPLLKPSKKPVVVERIRGLRIAFTIKLWKKKLHRSRWIWMRRYHLLSGWESKMQFDYVYESLLRN